MRSQSSIQRPVSRINEVLSSLKQIWHYYPELSLMELVTFITMVANGAKSDYPPISLYDIEDIEYPQGHLLHETRNLEMGIEALNKELKDKAIHATPIQTGVLNQVAKAWRATPQMRLGQLLSNQIIISE